MSQLPNFCDFPVHEISMENSLDFSMDFSLNYFFYWIGPQRRRQGVLGGDALRGLRSNIFPGAALHDTRVLAAAAKDVERAHSHPGMDLDVDRA